LLGMKGRMSELELSLFGQRSQEALRQMRHAACERLADGGFEFSGAIKIEQPQQRGRD